MHALRGESGKINLIAVGMLAVLAAMAYAVMFYVPPWMQNRMVSSAMREAAYQAWRTDDAGLRTIIRKKTDRVWVIQEGGSEVPLIQDDDIVIERDDQNVYIYIDYSVVADIPFTQDATEMSFENVATASLENPRAAGAGKKPGFWSFLGIE